jgi:hypothetical protein
MEKGDRRKEKGEKIKGEKNIDAVMLLCTYTKG